MIGDASPVSLSSDPLSTIPGWIFMTGLTGMSSPAKWWLSYGENPSKNELTLQELGTWGMTVDGQNPSDQTLSASYINDSIFCSFSIICCTTRIPKFSISFHSDLMSFFWYLQGLNQGLPLLHVFFSNIIHGDLNWYHREAWNFWALSGADGQRASLLATWRVTGLGHSE